MSINDQIAANETSFQEWFQRSWDAHHKENPSAADFKDVGDPRPTTRQKSYDYLDKRTVRVMVDFQSRPDDFVQLLQDYLINNALLLYQESIRIANLPGSVSFYKDCGNQVGMVECHLSREGQIVTIAIGYQTYDKTAQIIASPDAMKMATHQKKIKLKRIIYLRNIKNVYDSFVFLWMAIAMTDFIYIVFFRAIGNDVSTANSWFLGTSCLFFISIWPYLAKFSDRFSLDEMIESHVAKDLSHTFFPVAYYSNEDVTAAQTQNKDHAAFLERIRSVIDRAVAFGESSHNQRS
jgi:hypothetical protein